MSVSKKAELFLKKIIYFFLGLVFRNKPFFIPVNPFNIKKILLLRYDRLGDMVVTIPLIRSLKGSFPGITIDVVASGRNGFILDHEKAIRNVYQLKSGLMHFQKLTRELKKEKYDIIFCLVSSKTTFGGIFANCAGTKATIKVIQGFEKRNKLYSVLFNVLTDQPRDKKKMGEMLLEQASMVFGSKFNSDLKNYALELDDKSIRKAESFISINKLNSYVFLNISAGSEIKCLSYEQNNEIALHLLRMNKAIILCHSPEDKVNAEKIAKDKCGIIIIQPENDLMISALIKEAEFVISPDTAIVHIAASFNKKGIAFYTPANGPVAEWLPLSCSIKVILADGNKKAEEIPVSLILKEIDSLLTDGKNENRI